MVYLGIDPGASGGLAVVKGNNVTLIKMPSTEAEVWDVFQCSEVDFAVIEQVGGYTKASGGGEGGGAANGSAMFKFGRSYGMLLMALTAAQIPFEEVHPAKWQKGLGIAPKHKGKKKVVGLAANTVVVGSESKVQFKNRLKHKAEQLFPGVKVTLATSDALLLAEYGRRLREGKL